MIDSVDVADSYGPLSAKVRELEAEHARLVGELASFKDAMADVEAEEASAARNWTATYTGVVAERDTARTEAAQLRLQVQELMKALYRIADGEPEVLGLRSELYGHAMAIARTALGRTGEPNDAD